MTPEMTPPSMTETLIKASKDREELILAKEALKVLNHVLYCKDKEILLLRNWYLYGSNRSTTIEVNVQ